MSTGTDDGSIPPITTAFTTSWNSACASGCPKAAPRGCPGRSSPGPWKTLALQISFEGYLHGENPLLHGLPENLRVLAVDPLYLLDLQRLPQNVPKSLEMLSIRLNPNFILHEDTYGIPWIGEESISPG